MIESLRPSHEAPFRGLRVLDFGQGVASPYAGYLLATNGADVIKVEPPEGDWSRRLGTVYGNQSALSAVYNRGKRSLALDLKKPEAIETAKKLASAADVLIEGFRPGVMDRLGLGYDALSHENPRLIYLSISGFGQQGPYSSRMPYFLMTDDAFITTSSSVFDWPSAYGDPLELRQLIPYEPRIPRKAQSPH